MKYILFLLTINFLIIQCPAEYWFSDPLNSFLSRLGIGSNSPRFQEIQPAPDTEKDLQIDRIYEPLELVLVSFDGMNLSGAVGNPMFLRQYIRSNEFVDVLYACPKKESEKDAQLAKTVGRDKVPMIRTLIIEKSYKHFVDKYIEEAKLSKKLKENDANDARDGTNAGETGTISKQEQQPKQDTVLDQKHAEKNVSEHTPMELDSAQNDNLAVISSSNDGNHNLDEPLKHSEVIHEENKNPVSDSVSWISKTPNSNREEQIMEFETTPILSQQGNEDINSSLEKKFKRKDSSGHISFDDEKNRVDFLDQQEKKQYENPSGQNKMEIDSGSTQKTDGTDVEKTETDHPASIRKTDDAPNETETNSASNQKPIKAKLTKSTSVKIKVPFKPKFKRSLENLTQENESYWFQAVKDVENFKCERPIKIHLLEFQSNETYKIYIAGFEVDLGQHERFEYEEFGNLNKNQKIKFFWSFTIVFTRLDHSVCVYHEVQYNKDTYNSEINDDFDDHDLGNDDMFPDLDIIQLYNIENQEKVFSKLFEKKDERKKYFDFGEGRFLKRLHLAPLHGFLSPVVRQSAKTYGNVAPMWKSIKNGAWGRLEEYVNTLSTVLKHLVVITGTYGTLNLDGNDVYLADDQKIPVPLAYWKMVIHQNDLDDFPGILIITSNNPYEDIGNIICKEDKCNEFGWGYVRENELSRGRTSCCNFTPEILKDLPILNGAQPTQALNLKKLLPLVDEIWEFDEQGKPTTPRERIKILERLKKGKNLDEKVSVADEKPGNFVENQNTKIKYAGHKEIINEDVENNDPDQTEETDPLIKKGFKNFSFPKRDVEIHV